jgi:hypothetical protein
MPNLELTASADTIAKTNLKLHSHDEAREAIPEGDIVSPVQVRTLISITNPNLASQGVPELSILRMMCGCRVGAYTMNTMSFSSHP